MIRRKSERMPSGQMLGYTLPICSLLVLSLFLMAFAEYEPVKKSEINITYEVAVKNTTTVTAKNGVSTSTTSFSYMITDLKMNGHDIALTSNTLSKDNPFVNSRDFGPIKFNIKEVVGKEKANNSLIPLLTREQKALVMALDKVQK